MLPEILAVNLFADRLVHAIENPGWISGIIVAAIAMVMIAVNLWVTKRLNDASPKD